MTLKQKLNTIAQHANKFRTDISGNFGMLTAVCAFPIVAIMGGAVDVYRITNSESILQNATDSAALSAASLTNSTDIETIADEYVRSSLPNDDLWNDVDITVDRSQVSLASREITISARINVPSTFLSIAGIDSTPIEVSTSAIQKATKFEISLVLDISSSMRGAKIANLKEAAKNFINQVLDDGSSVPLVSVNLVPYGGSVNIGSLFDSYVTEANRSIVDPTQDQYKIGSQVLNGAFRFSDGLNCIEARNEDYTDGLLPGHSRAQVPHFWVWYNTNPWCPREESSVVLNSNNREELHNHIDNLTLSDGTGSDIGLLWGARFLSPAWRGQLGGDFADRPADYNEEFTTKVVVFMTDGAITGQYRPIEYIDGMDRANNRKNRQIPVSKGAYSHKSTAASAYGRLKRVCELLDEKGVKVFTIGFKIGKKSAAAKQMRDCAANGGNYYPVDSFDINSAFEAIGSSISSLRVSG